MSEGGLGLRPARRTSISDGLRCVRASLCRRHHHPRERPRGEHRAAPLPGLGTLYIATARRTSRSATDTTCRPRATPPLRKENPARSSPRTHTPRAPSTPWRFTAPPSACSDRDLTRQAERRSEIEVVMSGKTKPGVRRRVGGKVRAGQGCQIPTQSQGAQRLRLRASSCIPRPGPRR